uniref:Uncharacterized protein n=1 Tax=Arundo donax TaxID=35708 RepID=A0A0A9ABI4_ARUDO
MELTIAARRSPQFHPPHPGSLLCGPPSMDRAHWLACLHLLWTQTHQLSQPSHDTCPRLQRNFPCLPLLTR